MITQRCRLVRPSLSDKVDLIKLFSNEHTRRFLGGKQSDEAIKARCSTLFLDTKGYHASVRSRQTNEFLGLLGVSPYHDASQFELSYEFLPEHWGRGYAEETLRTFLPTAMQKLGISSVLAETQLQNTRSTNLLKKLGMKPLRELERFGVRQVIYRFDG
ncbi:hypothetical protein GCM10007094_05430 [Pseudovibrio japonicus]|uniref:N-acetyltransferase domain-containing protein n=1 Tax=Pseudovibrio japonicus TaxID=366534 RepID=A0ABQ3E1D0_9HYPH|nr:GNAT family N-acetyltransferase [Pseudovibrio japonicus]GHB20372.1 hypothetical protein GCM10007094_05430 [Pseudovibrio japonicus]